MNISNKFPVSSYSNNSMVTPSFGMAVAVSDIPGGIFDGGATNADRTRQCYDAFKDLIYGKVTSLAIYSDGVVASDGIVANEGPIARTFRRLVRGGAPAAILVVKGENLIIRNTSRGPMDAELGFSTKQVKPGKTIIVPLQELRRIGQERGPNISRLASISFPDKATLRPGEEPSELRMSINLPPAKPAQDE